jgi:hypothetical protein
MTCDFLARTHGTVWQIEAISDAAKTFAEENLEVASWMGTPTNFTTDWRPARDLCEQLDADGFSIWRA